MKAPVPIPKSLRIIDREEFLSMVEKRGHALFRAQVEAPDNHLLVIFADAEERFAAIVEVGPVSAFPDLRRAIAEPPVAGLYARYVVPCVNCPPYAIPNGLAMTVLPASLAPLTPPPADFKPTENAGEEEEVLEEELPGLRPQPTMRLSSGLTRPPLTSKPAVAGPAVPAPARVTAPLRVEPVAIPAVKTVSPAATAAATPVATPALPADTGSLTALIERSLRAAEKNFADRDAGLRRREAEFVAKEQALEKECAQLRDEAARLNAEFTARESEVARREAELRSRAESLLATFGEFDELRRRLAAFAGK